LQNTFSLEPGSVSLSDVQFGPETPLTFTVKIFPLSGMGFNRSDVIRISSALVNQTYKAPRIFGPYSFIAIPYFPSKYTARVCVPCFVLRILNCYSFISGPSSKKSSMSKGAIIGIAIAVFVLTTGLVLVAIYALRQKRIAKEAAERSANPFGD
jgi:hypothetical protein